MRLSVRQAAHPLRGALLVPGDKSISHRAVLFAAMASGTSHLSGLLDSADVRSTIQAVETLGAASDLAPAPDGSGLEGTLTGWGETGPVEPLAPVDCGNSGTTARLLMGVLAGWPISVTLVGDESLSRRPMARVTEPLSASGAVFTTRQGCLPVTVQGAARPVALTYESPVASAQVKTAVLLAGLRAHGRTTTTEPALSRDHTERMLPLFGVPVDSDAAARSAALDGPAGLHPATLAVPADPSSAAFPAIAALLVPESEVVLKHVGLNPTRTGFLRVLSRMGARIDVSLDPDTHAEPAGRVVVRYTPDLIATVVTADEVPSLIDEIPILAVLAASARGTSRFEGVSELRVKESDRLAAIVEGLGTLGVEAAVDGDALEILGTDGAPFIPAQPEACLDSLGDHRLAMSWALAGLATAGGVVVERFEAVDVSYPRFRDDLAALGAW